MRKEVKELEIFKFNELDEKTRERLIEEEKEYQKATYCECFLYDDMKEKAKELLKKYFKGKAILKAIYYDLSYCQGSGAMMEFNFTYYNKNVSIKQYGHYYHERSFTIESLNELTEKQEKFLEEKIIAMNEELANYGYYLIENIIETNDIISILQENEYLQDGKIYM